MKKSRTVGQGLPSMAVPAAGTFSLPAVMAALAAVKNAGALQYANCPNTLPLDPLMHLASPRLCPGDALRVRSSPLYPNQMPTIAPAGSVGRTGGTSGLSPLSTTSGL